MCCRAGLLDRDRVVKGRERGQRIEIGDDRVVDQHRLVEPRPAVDNAMADRLDRADRNPGDDKPAQEILDACVAILRLRGVGTPVDRLRRHRLAPRRVEDARLERR